MRSKKTKICLGVAIAIMLTYFYIQTGLLFNFIWYNDTIGGICYGMFLLFVPFFIVIVKEYINNLKSITKKLSDFEKMVDLSVLISRADKNGKIVYVNKKFEDVSGWKLEEVIGKDHNIVNSGMHPKEMWSEMYHVVIKEKNIWNKIITNKSKDGNLYWVDSFIKAEFDKKGNLIGFTSIRYDVSDIIRASQELEKKNSYLEHAAKILRHDMHSGINTYIPRGITSLKRRLSDEKISELKLESPLKLLEDGLHHTQKVYKSVYEFTNLVKKDVVLNKEYYNLSDILNRYLSTTPYNDQVIVEGWLPEIEVNEPLFCTALDNLVRNGLKYNDSETKLVVIFMEDEQHLAIQDNGRGMTNEEFITLSEPYKRREGQKESGSGLGLNICTAIIKEHGFEISSEKNEVGTKIKIKVR